MSDSSCGCWPGAGPCPGGPGATGCPAGPLEPASDSVPWFELCQVHMPVKTKRNETDCQFVITRKKGLTAKEHALSDLRYPVLLDMAFLWSLRSTGYRWDRWEIATATIDYNYSLPLRAAVAGSKQFEPELGLSSTSLRSDLGRNCCWSAVE